MFNWLTKELIDGKKTYSVTGFAAFSNMFHKFSNSIPATAPEWTELFNMLAAFGAVLLVAWRLGAKMIKWYRKK